MELQSVTPGIYYQDILADGSRSVLRQNFPTLERVSFDKRPPVVETLKITVERVFLVIDNDADIEPPLVLKDQKSELTIEQAEKLYREGNTP